MTKSRILIIAAEGLEQFIPGLGAAAAIRSHHCEAEIIVLTAKSLASFAKTAPYFDQVWVDDLRGTWDLTRIWALRKRLIACAFERVYDLDASAKSARIFWLMYGLNGLPLRRRNLQWSGAAKNTALTHGAAQWNAMHVIDRLAAQLSAADISGMHRPDLSWVARNVQSFDVPFPIHERFVLVALSSNAGSTWPISYYAELAQLLHVEGYIPVLAGFDVAPEFCSDIARACDSALNLVNQVSPEDLVFLAWAACAAVGPNNGMMHVTAAAACHSVILYDTASDPALVGQRGESVIIIRRPRLSDISAGEVMTAIIKSTKIRDI